MPKSAQQIRFCTSRDGTRIAFATCGEGPPLLFAQHWVHHLEHDWDSPIWRPWLELLTRRHSVIRYDWRGCGLSDREGVEFAPDRYLDDLTAVADAAGLSRFTLVWYGARRKNLHGLRRPPSRADQPTGAVPAIDRRTWRAGPKSRTSRGGTHAVQGHGTGLAKSSAGLRSILHLHVHPGWDVRAGARLQRSALSDDISDNRHGDAAFFSCDRRARCRAKGPLPDAGAAFPQTTPLSLSTRAARSRR